MKDEDEKMHKKESANSKKQSVSLLLANLLLTDSWKTPFALDKALLSRRGKCVFAEI